MGLALVLWLQVLFATFFIARLEAFATMVEVIASNKKLLVTKGIATRSRNATRGSWPYY